MAFGATEVIIILLAIIFLFGGKRFVDWVSKIKEAKEELSKPAKGKKSTKKSKKKK